MLIPFLSMESATAKTVTITLYGGTISCEKWNSVSEDNITKNIAKVSKSAWVAGYMTGINVASSNNNFKKISVITAGDYITDFCRKNPSSDIVDAMDSLQENLLKLN